MADIDEQPVAEAIQPTEEGAPPVDQTIVHQIAHWQDQIRLAKKFHEPRFKRMRAAQKFAANTGDAQWDGAPDKYVANITRRHLSQKTASLYAKNPKVKATRTPRLEYQIWDGSPQAIQEAMMTLQADPMNIEAMMLLQDIQEGRSRSKMFDTLGKTMEIMFEHAMRENNPDFKKSCKQLVRRSLTNGVGYVKLLFQRATERNPETLDRIQDITQRLATIDRLQHDLELNPGDKDAREIEELRATLTALQSETEVVIREGIGFDFPKSTAVIIDPACTDIVEFIGARWLVHEFHFSKKKVFELYQKDLGNQFNGYVRNPTVIPQASVDAVYSESGRDQSKETDLACVWEVWDKTTGTVFTICDGYKDYLKAPAAPAVKTERFFTLYELVLNAEENEFELIPDSDVDILMDIQKEYNRARDGLREHRRASRPFYVSSAGTLEDADKDKIRNRIPFEILDLIGLPPGTDIAKVVQEMSSAPIDPNMYEVGPIFDDAQRAGGQSEASLGIAPKTSATGASIAESSRSAAADSNIDDLDDMLTLLCRDGGQVMLMNIDRETVVKIVGPGAVWPEFSRQEVAEEIYLEIIAGSSGKPNRAQEIANFERMAPYLIQIPGIDPNWMAKEAIMRLDERIPLEDSVADGLPSITALNAMAGTQVQPGTGDGDSDPNQQGGEGGDNTAQPPEQTGGPQPAFPVGDM